jgi:hypothetical protein
MRLCDIGMTTERPENHLYPYEKLPHIVSHLNPRYVIYQTGLCLSDALTMLQFVDAMRPGERDLVTKIVTIFKEWMATNANEDKEFKRTRNWEMGSVVTRSSVRTKRRRTDMDGLLAEEAQSEELEGTPSRRGKKRAPASISEGDYLGLNGELTVDNMEPSQKRRRIEEWVKGISQEGNEEIV